jgi:hypothetical protein
LRKSRQASAVTNILTSVPDAPAQKVGALVLVSHI